MATRLTRSPRLRRFDDASVKALNVDATRYAVPDPEMRRLYVQITPNGSKSFAVVTRDAFKRQHWITLAPCEHIGIDEARTRARDVIVRVKAGKPAFEPPPVAPESFKAIAQQWVKRHVEEKKLRSRDKVVWLIEKYIFPSWGERVFTDLKRRDVAALLDHVADNHGKRQADLVLAAVSGICNWFQSRNDDYVSPVVR